MWTLILITPTHRYRVYHSRSNDPKFIFLTFMYEILILERKLKYKCIKIIPNWHFTNSCVHLLAFLPKQIYHSQHVIHLFLLHFFLELYSNDIVIFRPKPIFTIFSSSLSVFTYTNLFLFVTDIYIQKIHHHRFPKTLPSIIYIIIEFELSRSFQHFMCKVTFFTQKYIFNIKLIFPWNYFQLFWLNYFA